MIIKLPDLNERGIKPRYVGDRLRNATATGVRFLDARRMLVSSCVGQRIYLIEFDMSSGSHQVLDEVTTRCGQTPWMTDLIDFDGHEHIVTSDCGMCSVSIYRLAGNRLAFVKSISLAPPHSGFCHGASFVPGTTLVCAAFSTGNRLVFADRVTDQIALSIETGEWRPKDVCFIDGSRMVVLFAEGVPTTTPLPRFRCKVGLFALNLPSGTLTSLHEQELTECHVDACCYAGGRVFVNHQPDDSIIVFKVDGDRLCLDREFGKFDFPHGVHALPEANLLAVTNYGSNTVALGPLPPSGPPSICRDSRVLAVITHFGYERWLGECLASIVRQTRPPDGIVVVDDGSTRPPIDVARRFPQVTLLGAAQNVGPYRLLQSLLQCIDHDALLIQDADDWSVPHRLETLLAAAESSGAGIVASQFDEVLEDGSRRPFGHRPAHATAAYAACPDGHFVCFGASLIACRLLQRLGGFASGLRFSADAELFRRARHVAFVENVPDTLYFRRRHATSLTQHPDTGMASGARHAVDHALKGRAAENAERVRAGLRPDLSPYATAPVVPLKHLAGPPLRG